MGGLIYLEVYREVLRNKSLYEEKCASFFDDVIKKQWVGLGKTKLNTIDRKLAFDYFGGSQLQKEAFFWFLGTDLNNCDKYISRVSMNGWEDPGFKVHEFDRAVVDADGAWESISIMDFGRYVSDDNFSRYSGSNIETMSRTVVGLLDIQTISELFSDGYKKWLGKQKKSGANIPKQISNKMQFILWKKAIGKAKMTKKHLEDLTKISMGKWSMAAYNELYKVKGLKEKKYFQEKIERTWFRDVSNCHFELAMTKLNVLAKYKYGKSASWQEGQVIEYLENVDLKTGKMTGVEFVQWVVDSGVLRRIRFKEKENSYFKKELFIEHLKRIYR